MNYRKWLRLFIICNIFLFFTIILTTIYFHNNGVPLRMTNSISYDAKLNFLKKSKLLSTCDTIVIGSSMALNNIDSLTLQENNKDIKKIANVASWGLQTSESLELLKILNLKKIKRIIFSTQFNDFMLVRYKDVEKNNVKKFLYSDNLKDTILLPYFNTVNSIIPNFLEYLNWKNIYQNKNSNKYLAFDENGDVNLTFEKNKKEQNDWFVINPNKKLEEKIMKI